MPIRIAGRLELSTIVVAAIYGLLVTLLFALWPLGRAEEVTAGALFREVGGRMRRLPRWPYLLGLAEVSARHHRAVYWSFPAVSLIALSVLGWGHAVPCSRSSASAC